MNKYLIFRTDRIGDFLVSAILINNIKINDPKSHVIVISSSKNTSYIKSFDYVDEVIELKNNIYDKIKLIIKLFKYNFKSIIIHDNKKRSKFVTFFLKSDNKIFIKKNINKVSHIDEIKYIIKKLNFDFFSNSLNILDQKSKNYKKENTIQFHFDEKWIHNSYIKNYKSIEPNDEQIINFLNNVIEKKKMKLIVTTGLKLPILLSNLRSRIESMNIEIYEKMNFQELEKITLSSNILISCHGAISHVAAANNIKQIDIIDKSYNYSRWTKHFRNYNCIYRDNFTNLSKEILQLI